MVVERIITKLASNKIPIVYENNSQGITFIHSSPRKKEAPETTLACDKKSNHNSNFEHHNSVDLLSKYVSLIKQQLPELQTENCKQIWFYKSDSKIELKIDDSSLVNSSQAFTQKLSECLTELGENKIKNFRLVSIDSIETESLDFISIDFSNHLKNGCYAEILGLELITDQLEAFQRYSNDQFHEWTLSENSIEKINNFSSKIRPPASLSSWCAVNSCISSNKIHSWLRSIARAAQAINQRAIPANKCITENFKLSGDYVIFDEKNPWITPTENKRSASCFVELEENLFGLQLGETKFKGKALSHDSSAEVFIFSASDEKQLTNNLNEFKKEVKNISDNDLRIVAQKLSFKDYQKYRIAIVASTSIDLLKKIDKVLLGLSKRQKPSSRSKPGISWNTTGTLNPKIAAVLPGQGSQRYNMLKSLCIRFPKVREWYDSMESALPKVNGISTGLTIFPPSQGIADDQRKLLENNLHSQEGGNVAVIVSSIALNELLNSLGCNADILVGHSSGEISGLFISESINFPDRASLFEAILDVNQKGAQGDIRGEIPKGKFLAVTSSSEEVLEEFLEKYKSSVYLAMDNCPQQKVLFFSEEEYQNRYDELIQLGVICFPLYFERAYHTNLFEVEMPSIRKVYDAFDLQPPKMPLFSCINLVDFPNEPQAIRKLACLNWTHCVKFKEACEKLHDRGIRTFIEMGPSGVLSGFVSNTLKSRPHNALSLDQESVDSYTSLLNVLAKLFTEGVDLNLNLLFDDIEVNSQLNENTSKTKLNPVQEELKLPPIQINANQDIRSMIMKEHFAFMNEYLEMQTNMLNAVQLAQQYVPLNVSMNGNAPSNVIHRSVDHLPMIDRIKYQDETSCIAQRTISRKTDLFLQHHTLGRFIFKKPNETEPLPVVPLAMNIEMMVEAASLLTSDNFFVTDIYNLKAARWMTIDQDTLTLNIETELLSQSSINNTKVRVKIIDENSPHLPYCMCDIELQPNYNATPEPMVINTEKPKTTLWNAESFFEQCLFHGEAFSSITNLLSLGEEAIEVELAIPKSDILFKDIQSPNFLTQAQVLDVPGHAIAWWQVEFGDKCFGIFPISIDHIQFFGPPLNSESKAIGRGKNKKVNNIVESEFELLNSDGTLHIKTTGFKFIYYKFQNSFLRSHYWSGPNSYYSEPIDFINPKIIGFEAESLKNDFFKQSNGLWLRSLVHMYCNENEREQWKNLTEKGNRKEEWFLGRVAAKEIIKKWAFYVHSIYILCPDIEIKCDKNGRPYAVCPELEAYGSLPDISITHSSSIAIAIATNAGFRVGVDLEYFPKKTQKSLSDLNERLEIAFTEEELDLFRGKEKNIMYELVCAKEAASKAIGIGFLGFMKSFKIKSYKDTKVEIEIFDQLVQVDIQKEAHKIIATCIMPLAQTNDIIKKTETVESL